MSFLSDKIIDDQGNVKTIAGGQDARLYYVDLNGNRKPYLLDGESSGGVTSVNGKSGDVIIDTLDITYQDVLGIALESYTYNTVTQPVGNETISIPAGIKNAMCTFTTDELEFTYTLNIDSSYKVNKPFEFETNSTYVIAVDNGVILWSKIETIEG